MGRHTGSAKTDVLDGITSPVMLLAYAVVVPFLVFLFFMGGDLRRAIPAAESERLGLAQVRVLEYLMVDAARERAFRTCGTPASPGAVERDVVAIQEMEARQPFAAAEWQSTVTAWRTGPVGDRPSGVIRGLIGALRITSDESKLTYDPEVRGIDIADALTYRLPGAFDAFRRAQAALCDVHGVSPAQRLGLEADAGALRILMSDVASDVQEAISLQVPLETQLTATENSAESASDAAVRALDRVAASPSRAAQLAAAAATDRAAGDLERLSALLAPSLGRIVDERLVALKRRLVLTLAPSIVAILAGILVGVLGVRGRIQNAEMARLRAYQMELRHQATHDALTTLPNRAAFFTELDATLERMTADRSSVAVLFIDLDNFKAVNDGYGHAAGDHVLRSASQRLTSICTAAGGRMTARLGGDEFAMLIDDGDPARVHERIALVVDGIARDLARPLALEGFEAAVVRLSASVGVAFADGSLCAGRAADEMLREADAAMYESKAKARERASSSSN